MSPVEEKQRAHELIEILSPVQLDALIGVMELMLDPTGDPKSARQECQAQGARV
jgi:hypothetical protein